MEFIFALVGYLLGSVPFGLLLTKAAGLGDIRAIGSGNIGATNVLRTGNKKLAAAVLLLDGAKGVVAVLLARAFAHEDAALWAGLFSIIGHVFPIWLNFKGGKGVATALGMFLALAPWAGAVACAVWLVMAAAVRYSSLSALVAMLSLPVSAYLIYGDVRLTLVAVIVCGLVWYTHRANIQRLLRGEEPKIGRKKS